MIELLVLYVLQEKDLTVYSIRKSIIDNFGIYTKPSLGAIYPALQRLIKQDAVEVTENISSGGKKICYHHLTNSGKKLFNEIFCDDIGENPLNACNLIRLKISLLNKTKTNIALFFLENSILKLDHFIYDTKNYIETKKIKLDKIQLLNSANFLQELSNIQTELKKIQFELKEKI